MRRAGLGLGSSGRSPLGEFQGAPSNTHPAPPFLSLLSSVEREGRARRAGKVGPRPRPTSYLRPLAAGCHSPFSDSSEGSSFNQTPISLPHPRQY